MKIFKRKCPICGKELTYKKGKRYWEAVVTGEVCKLCFCNFICEYYEVYDYEDFNKTPTERKLTRHFSGITLEKT